jgi:D-arabinan exo alpha-(1,3)/(1,5)-arabinofuranosidase (non-reducing end)
MARSFLNVCLAGVFISAILSSPESCTAQQQPPIPIGLDAYRQWDRWPQQRIGMRAYMRSTYDRSGGNENADASHFLYQLSDNFNVTLDVEGPGILVFSRYNHWHGSPWHYVVDGKDHLVSESSTADPMHPDPSSVLLPARAFPALMNPTWATTRGSDLVWTPVPFERSFQMAYSRTHYGTGYYIYDQFVPGTPLSQPIRSWDESAPPPKDVLDLIEKSGTDIAPATDAKRWSGTIGIPPRRVVPILYLKGKETIRALTFSITRRQALAFQNVHLRVTWDNRKDPSIDVPIALFYGAGALYNRDNREYLVKAFPVSIRFTQDRIFLACYFPMPFFRSARIELTGADQAIDDVEWSVRALPLHQPANQLAYFHATYRDIPQPVPGEDMVLLDTRGIEGSNDWSGSFVGTSFIFSHNAQLSTLEGDPRFFFDDSLTPQAQGTGTEEWGGGGDYWGGLNMTLPLVGHPVGARNPKVAVNDEDKIESAYRFLLADLMPFGKNALIRMEHGGTDGSTEHYETIAYWYGLPSPSLIETDRLQIGDLAEEHAHGYRSPQASAPYTLSSRYEWGVDTFNGKEVFPETQDTGRTTTTASEFHLHIRADNLGVLIRRKLDYSFPNQRAEVYIAANPKLGWKFAGIWYLAGSNSCVYSHPRSELGLAEHTVETSNRRFRDDEFLVPRILTHGKKAIWIRIKFTPVNRPLYPGYPLAQQAWSEIRYTAYSFVVPGNLR